MLECVPDSPAAGPEVVDEIGEPIFNWRLMKSTRLTVATMTVGLVVFSVSLAAAVCWTRSGPPSLSALLAVFLFCAAIASLAGWWLGDRLARPWENFVCQLARLRNSTERPLLQSQTDDPFARTATQEVNALVAELAQSQEQLNFFAAKVAHELRAPITLLQLQIDYAAGKLDPALVEGLRAQIKRLTDYVDTALLVARAEQGNIPLSKENCNLGNLISELLQPYDLRAKTSRRPIHCTLKQTVTAEIDPKIFGLIFNNLMSNAFYHGSGEIRVRLYQRHKVPELLILNRVRQKTDESKTHEAGTGMGLKTTYQLAQAHQSLTVETRRRQGSFVARVRFA
jgi:two-component system, OmpR family, sensor histidine kinase BaeS